MAKDDSWIADPEEITVDEIADQTQDLQDSLDDFSDKLQDDADWVQDKFDEEYGD